MRRWMGCTAAVLAAGLVVVNAFPSRSQEEAPEGQWIYLTYCSGCHGEDGQGKTLKSWFLRIEPRDLTRGRFKFKSTPGGSLPRDEDLYDTVTGGILRTAMPQYGRLTDSERYALVDYIKTLSPRWQADAPAEAIVIPEPPMFTHPRQAVARGEELYQLLQCGACHGSSGEGDGRAAETLAPDCWGNPQAPCDLRRGMFKGGNAERDLYRTIVLGLDGTAMAAYGHVFEVPDGIYILEDDAWRLVAYVLSLQGRADPF